MNSGKEHRTDEAGDSAADASQRDRDDTLAQAALWSDAETLVNRLAIYALWHDKPTPVDGVRLTIMAPKTRYRSDEFVRVAHVVEYVEPGRTVYPMGPKTAYGVYADGQLRSAIAPDPGNALTPLDYDGLTLPSPGIDANYAITTLRLPVGSHEIVWRADSRASNVLRIMVSDTEE